MWNRCVKKVSGSKGRCFFASVVWCCLVHATALDVRCTFLTYIFHFWIWGNFPLENVKVILQFTIIPPPLRGGDCIITRPVLHVNIRCVDTWDSGDIQHTAIEQKTNICDEINGGRQWPAKWQEWRYSRWNTMTYGRRNGQNQSTEPRTAQPSEPRYWDTVSICMILYP